MNYDSKLKKLVDLVIKNTIKKNIPTLVFLSDTDHLIFIKNIISLLLNKEYDENTFTKNDWNNLADILLKLANIPLVIKPLISVKKTVKYINSFSKELGIDNGYVIIECGKHNFSKNNSKKNIIIEKI